MVLLALSVAFGTNVLDAGAKKKKKRVVPTLSTQVVQQSATLPGNATPVAVCAKV